VLTGAKATDRVTGAVTVDAGLLAGAAGLSVQGYEFILGRSISPGDATFRLQTRSGATCESAVGALSADGRVLGTYLHGLLENDGVRAALLGNVAAWRGRAFTPATARDRDAAYDRLAAVLREAFDLPSLYRLAGL
jgi:adenosylcobyric acid synthase